MRPYDKPGRAKPFGVRSRARIKVGDGYKDKSRFKFFKTKNERDAYLREVKKKTKHEGGAVFRLSSEEAITMEKCIEEVGDAATVLLACKQYAQRHKVKTISVSDAIQEFKEEQEKLGRDVNYARAIRMHFERMKAFLPESLPEWTAESVRQWALLLSDDFAPVTVKNHLRTGTTFCHWAVKRGFMTQNPFVGAPVPKIIKEEPGILTVAEMKRFLETAADHYPHAVAYTALNAFGGLRSSLCARLDLAQFDFKARGVLIRADQAKNNVRTYLDGHPENMWKWLDWAKSLKTAKEGFGLTKRQWDRVRGQVADKAGIKMPHNAFRHSFCTYHVALHGDAGKTATLLTHRGNVSILYEHYKGNATKAEGEDYFAMAPPA